MSHEVPTFINHSISLLTNNVDPSWGFTSLKGIKFLSKRKIFNGFNYNQDSTIREIWTLFSDISVSKITSFFDPHRKNSYNFPDNSCLIIYFKAYVVQIRHHNCCRYELSSPLNWPDTIFWNPWLDKHGITSETLIQFQ